MRHVTQRTCDCSELWRWEQKTVERDGTGKLVIMRGTLTSLGLLVSSGFNIVFFIIF